MIPEMFTELRLMEDYHEFKEIMRKFTDKFLIMIRKMKKYSDRALKKKCSRGKQLNTKNRTKL